MITVFTTPKPFHGHFGRIQRNAIRSWTSISPGVQVLVFGRESGIEDVAEDLGVEHHPEVQRNEFGTPLINDLFSRAAQAASNPLLMYANADVIFTDDLLPAVQRVARRWSRFLMVGQRWDLDIDEAIEFHEGWQSKIRLQTRRYGKLHAPTAMDYFVFPRDLWRQIPPLAVGRARWDNWILFHARELGIPLFDATPSVVAIHQNHDYSHAGEGQEWVYRGPEAKRNLELAGGWDKLYTLRDATHVLTPRRIRRTFDRWHLERHLETLPQLHSWTRRPVGLIRRVIDLTRALRERIGWTLPSVEEQERYWTSPERHARR